MNKTNIEWTATLLPDGTLRPGFSANPLKYRRKSDGKVVWGCVKTSPGCAHCYSEAIALRFERGKLFNAKNMEELEPFLDEAELRKMLTAKTVGGIPVAGSRVFVGDMTDVFGAWVPDELLDRLFAVFALRADVTWQLLTKRAERMQEYLTTPGLHNHLELAADAIRPGKGHPSFGGKHMLPGLPLPGVWLGVSVEDQKRADERIPLLLATPAAVRFLSCEPLLSAVDLSSWLCDHQWGIDGAHSNEYCKRCFVPRERPGGIGLVIGGGESGPKSRPCNIGWLLSLLGQCKAAGVPCFVKQLGSKPMADYYLEPENMDLWEWCCEHEAGVLQCYHGDYSAWSYRDGQPPPGSIRQLKLRDGKGGDMAEFPEELRVRQFPEAPHA